MLELKNLKIGYNGTPLLEEINLTARSGQVVALIGLNGSGKSTLLRTIAALLPAIDGKIYLNNKNIANFSPKQLAKNIGFTNATQIPSQDLTVFDFVGLGRVPHTGFSGLLNDYDKKIIKEAIEITNINNLINRKLHTLSDGQRQKVSIARLIAQQTDILLLDEPTAFLDINAKIEIFYLFKEISRQTNKLIIFSTHDLQFAIEFADYIWLISGKELFSAIAEDLILNGIFSKNFSNKNIFFDNFTGNFTLKKGKKYKIKILNNSTKIRYVWTLKALERLHFYEDDRTNLTVEILDDKWLLSNKNEKKTFNNLNKILTFLQQNIIQ